MNDERSEALVIAAETLRKEDPAPAASRISQARIDDLMRKHVVVRQDGYGGTVLELSGFARAIEAEAATSLYEATAALREAAQEHLESLDNYDRDVVPINRTRGTAAALRRALGDQEKSHG